MVVSARWLVNRARWAVRGVTESFVMGAELRDVPGAFSYRDTRPERWAPSGATTRAQECPSLPGLWLARRALEPEEAERVAEMTERVCDVATDARDATRWRWYHYESDARQVAPVLPEAVAPGALSELEDFEVFGGVPPSRWLELAQLERVGCERVRRGARLLSALHADRLPALAVPGLEAASFLQLQALQRGTGVMPHIDAATPRAEVVATVGLRGHCTVRVGHVELEVGVGDVYCLEGRARWKVKHEVLPSRVDRLSVTIRYNPREPPGPPALEGRSRPAPGT